MMKAYNLTEWRKWMHLSKGAASLALGYHHDMLSKYERKAIPVPHTLALACVALLHRIEPIDQTQGALLRWRVRMNCSQAQAAFKLGLNAHTYGNYERGKSHIRRYVALAARAVELKLPILAKTQRAPRKIVRRHRARRKDAKTRKTQTPK